MVELIRRPIQVAFLVVFLVVLFALAMLGSQVRGPTIGTTHFSSTVGSSVPQVLATFYVVPTSAGPIMVDGMEKHSGDTGTYKHGWKVHIVAPSPPGYTFTQWEGNACTMFENAQAPDTYVSLGELSGGCWVLARFTQVTPSPPALHIDCSPAAVPQGGIVIVSGSGATPPYEGAITVDGDVYPSTRFHPDNSGDFAVSIDTGMLRGWFEPLTVGQHRVQASHAGRLSNVVVINVTAPAQAIVDSQIEAVTAPLPVTLTVAAITQEAGQPLSSSFRWAAMSAVVGGGLSLRQGAVGSA